MSIFSVWTVEEENSLRLNSLSTNVPVLISLAVLCKLIDCRLILVFLLHLLVALLLIGELRRNLHRRRLLTLR